MLKKYTRATRRQQKTRRLNKHAGLKYGKNFQGFSVVPETGIEPVRPLRKARDFKSLVSTYFTTRAVYFVALEADDGILHLTTTRPIFRLRNNT